ncbi:MAG: hypothetical protein WBR29_08820 [Gammaproteobacteria bacterium]
MEAAADLEMVSQFDYDPREDPAIPDNELSSCGIRVPQDAIELSERHDLDTRESGSCREPSQR